MCPAMDTRLLIDGIVRQTTILIAQLSTAAGIRAPLSNVADQVFLSLAREIEAQGVGRKVVADMFGMALRTYQKKMLRLQESATVVERTLWQAVLDTLIEHGSMSRKELLERFAKDGEKETIGVLTDLVSSGLAYTSGRGPAMLYGVTSALDQQRMGDAQSAEAQANMLWVAIYREAGIHATQLADRLPLTSQEVHAGLEQLLADGRIQRDVDDADSPLRAETFRVPVGQQVGWESAVYDHFQAMAKAIANKLRQGDTRSQRSDLIGGTTLSFDLYAGHPEEQAVYGLLASFRDRANAVWDRVRAANEARPVSDDERIKVTFYFGQDVDDLDAAAAALAEIQSSPVTQDEPTS